MALATRDLRELAESIRGSIATDAGAIQRAGRDGSHLRGVPAAVVFPEDARDLLPLVAWARHHRVGLVARGGGTSLDGESVPADGSLVVDFSRWRTIEEVDPDARIARVQPGVVNAELDAHLAPFGLFFPPNPGSWGSCTLGGNVATNASGPRSFRYGPTRTWVLGLEVVTGAGEALELGGRALKRSVGPSLLDLFVGSEGTLGLFTRATLRLAIRPERRVGLVVPLKPAASPAKVAELLVRRSPIGLSAIEYVDARVAHALSERAGPRIPGDRPLVLVEVEGTEGGIDGQLGELDRTLQASGSTEEALVYPDANRLWTLRGESGVLLDRDMGERIREDVCVPLPRLAELFELLDRLAERYRVKVATFGHLGEGNLHPNFAIDPMSPEATLLRGDLLEGVHSLGGSISGEHGIGALKVPWFEREHGAAVTRATTKVKALFDPDGVLNPGKVYPT